MTDPALVLQQLPLQFTYNHRPTIPITFRSGKKSVNCTGLVDSGASYTLFHASQAQQLGIDLTNAPTLPFIGVGHGTITGYEAPVEIGIGGVFYPASVYFSHDLNPNVEGMLGQVGFFDNFVVEFDRSGKSLLVKDRNALVTAQLLQATNASVLGKEIASGQLVTIEQEERLKGFYVIGNTGSGKTTLLVNLILQDIEQGMGVCFFDTHGDAITDILKRLPVHREKDVILLDLLDSDYAFGLNLFQCSDPKNKQEASYTVNNVLDIFAKLFADGDLSKMPRMAQVLRNTAYTLVANPGTSMAEVPLLLTDENALEKLKKNVANPQVKL